MTDQEHGLKRDLGARQIAMVAVGGSIGTGLLLGSGAAIQVAGPAVIVSYVLSAAISFTVAMALGEMSAMHPAAGPSGCMPNCISMAGQDLWRVTVTGFPW